MTRFDRRWICVGLGAALSMPAAPVEAAEIDISLEMKLAGISILLPTMVNLASGPTPTSVSIGLRVVLNDLIAKLDKIVESSGLTRPPGNYQSFDYRGTIAAASEDKLWVKYHFRIDPRRAPATNGSVEIWLAPLFTPTSIRFVASGVRLNISNTIARAVVQAMGLHHRLEGKLLEAIEAALASPEARLQIPPELVGPHTRILGARFAREGGANLLLVNGEAALSPALLRSLYSRFGKSP